MAATPEKKTVYFSIVIPDEDSAVTQDKPVVVNNLKDLQPLLKRNSHARFRVFSTYEEAVDFMKSPNNADSGTPKKVQPGTKGRASLPNSARNHSQRNSEEQTNQFPTPSPQALMQLNTYIKAHLNTQLVDAIKLNPRLLCSDCDLPTVVFPGSRMNALHAAAQSNNLDAAKLVLKTISKISYFQLVAPSNDPNTIRDRCVHVNISYLNTPDKNILETPLHFAAKFNSIDIVRLLTKHPLCNLTPINNEDKTPYEIAGSRCNGGNSATTKREIRQCLEEIYIVPIWRGVVSATPRVGIYADWRSFGRKLPKDLLGPFADISEVLLPPFDESLDPFWKSLVDASSKPQQDSSPRKMNAASPKNGDVSSKSQEIFSPKQEENGSSKSLENILSKRREDANITSYAGPMRKEKAKEFYRLLRESSGRRVAENPLSPFGSPGVCSPTARGWSTPIIASPTGSPVKILSGSPLKSPRDLVLPSTPTKSLSSRSILDMSLRNEDDRKGLERVGRKYAKQWDVPWNEYWEFLDVYTNFETPHGLELLEEFFTAKENEYEEDDTIHNDFDTTIGSSSWSMDKATSSEIRMMEDDMNNVEASSHDNISRLIDELRSMRLASPCSSYESSRDKSKKDVKINEYSDNNFDVDTYYNNIPVIGDGEESNANQASPRKKLELEFTKVWGYRDSVSILDTSTTSSHNSTLSEHDCSLEGISDLSLDAHVSEDDDDRLSFGTAVSNFDEDSIYEDCVSANVFIDGKKPRSNDRQVYYAINDIVDDDMLLRYPAISRWYNTLKAGGYFKLEDNASVILRFESPSRCMSSGTKEMTSVGVDCINSVKREIEF